MSFISKTREAIGQMACRTRDAAMNLVKKHPVAVSTGASLMTTAATFASTSSSGTTGTITAGGTVLPTYTFTAFDIITSIAQQIYPAILPILTVGGVVFGAWWIWHRVRGAVS
jgi:DNA-binding transcriptional regulator LsrR (DeoR family)